MPTARRSFLLQLSAEDRDRTDFIIADSAANEEAEYYDAVLAMSVFRHGDLGTHPPRCDHLVRFADFDRTISGLAKCVKLGGYLVIRNANFRFADTQAAAAFRLVLRRPASARTPVYDRNDCLLPATPDEETVFYKLPPSERLDD